MAETPRMGGAGVNLLGRAALGGLRFGGRQLRRGAFLAAAPSISAVGGVTAGLAGSTLGLATGGIIGIAGSIRKNLSSMLKELKEQREKEEKFAAAQRVERNKEVSEKLEDVREGKEGDEDPDSGKGPITSRLRKVLKRINTKAKSAAKGLFSKIPGSSFLSGIAGKFAGSLSGMSATFIVGWAAAIAIGALVLKFIIDNINDWLTMGLIKVAKFIDSTFQGFSFKIPGTSLEVGYPDNAIEKKLLGRDVDSMIKNAEAKAREQIKREMYDEEESGGVPFDPVAFQEQIRERAKSFIPSNEEIKEQLKYLGYTSSLIPDVHKRLEDRLAESRRRQKIINEKRLEDSRRTIIKENLDILKMSLKEILALGSGKLDQKIFQLKKRMERNIERKGAGSNRQNQRILQRIQDARAFAGFTPTTGTPGSTNVNSANYIGPRQEFHSAQTNISPRIALGLGNPLDQAFNYVVKFNQ